MTSINNANSEDKLAPIHLGKLLQEAKEEAPKERARREVEKYKDHQVVVYKKALLSELPDKELELRKAEIQRDKEAQLTRKNYLQQVYNEEMQHSKINRMKLINDWRVIMRIAKIDEIRKYLTLYMQIFERDLDDKDAILQMLDRDITEAEEHYNIALTNHFIHVKQLMSLQDSRIKGLFREFERDVSELEREYETEFKEISVQFEQEQKEILRMLHNIEETYNIKIQNLNGEFADLKNSQLQRINEIYSHKQEAIRKAGIDVQNKFTNEMNDIRQKSDDKNAQDMTGIEKLSALEKEVMAKKKKVEKQSEDLKQYRLKIKQNNEDWDSKNDSIKKEKERIMKSYRILKDKLNAFRNMQREKLKKLVKNSWECETKLKGYIKLAEKILKLAEISRRLEIDKEKILPYYENSDIDKNEANNANNIEIKKIEGIDKVLYEEVESLQNFWKRYNKVKLDVIAIKKQKGLVERNNEVLKGCLQQYYDGFRVNNVVMTNENPLLRIDKVMDPLTNFDEGNGAGILQEGNHIVSDTRKQKVFMLAK